MKMSNHSFFGHMLSVAAIIAVILYPCLFIYFQNAGEASLSDIIPVTGAILGGALLMFGIVYFSYLKDMDKSAFAIITGSLLFLNFAFIEKIISWIFPMLFYWHVGIILIFICLFLVIFLKATKLTIFKFTNQIILLVFSVLIVMNAIMAAPVILKKISNGTEEKNRNLSVQAETGYHPNIYYFIFDEYGGIDNLKRYCGYDNSPFYHRLREIGFNVSEQSRNECDSTYTTVPNLLNLNYVNYGGQTDDANDIALRLENLENPALFQLLSGYGYQINILDSSDFLDASQASFCFDASYSGIEGSAAYYILQNTALYPFYRNSSSAEIQNLLEMVDYAKQSSEISDSNLFTMGYFHYPHTPWFVDENGNAISGADRVNYYNTDIYLGEVKFGNKFIEEIVLEIIKNDPNSVIILQSDHGFRWTLSGPAEDDLETRMFYKRNILNAVWFKGESLNIEGETGINTLRIVLNNLLDANLEMIDPNDYEKLQEKTES